jgi:hypothetical protein
MFWFTMYLIITATGGMNEAICMSLFDPLIVLSLGCGWLRLLS